MIEDNSIRVVKKNYCTGCMVCGDACPKGAISFSFSGGFWYPTVDSDLCINCGKCKRSCPSLHHNSSLEKPIGCYGVKSKNENLRWNSTSGGVFAEIGEYIISQNGYCVGAIYGENNKIIHSIEDNIDGVYKLQQSKYAQSYCLGVYRNTKLLLNKGEKVLFCGTPCQVEALKLFLNKEYENLITLDFACLGICSPIVYSKYLTMMEERYKSKVSKVWFKNKKAGWHAIGIRLEFENGKSYFRVGNRDPYMRLFVTESLSMRRCCEECAFRKIPHCSDVMVADFWGIEKVKPSFDDNKGVSAVIINSKKGLEIFSKLTSRFDIITTTEAEILRGNFSITSSKRVGDASAEFLAYIDNHSFTESVRKFTQIYSYKNRIISEWEFVKYIIKTSLSKVI